MSKAGRRKMRWDTSRYMRIVTARYDAGELVVCFADGSEARVDVGRMPRVQARGPDWPALVANEYDVVVPTANGDFEVSWLAIRSLTDPEFNAHLSASAEESARQIGRRIQELRERQGLTPEDLAKRTGLTPNILHRIEQGTDGIDLATLDTIMSSLGHSMKDLASTSPERSVA